MSKIDEYVKELENQIKPLKSKIEKQAQQTITTWNGMSRVSRCRFHFFRSVVYLIILIWGSSFICHMARNSWVLVPSLISSVVLYILSISDLIDSCNNFENAKRNETLENKCRSKYMN